MPIEDVAGNDAADFGPLVADVVDGFYTLELCDLKTDTLLAVLTGAATFEIKPRRSGVPTQLIARLAGDNADIREIWTDGDGVRKLSKLRRTLKVRLDGVLIAHCVVWRTDYNGDKNTSTCEVTAYDALQTIKGRPYRDATGNMVDPNITGPVAGATILRDGVDNSVSNSGPAGDQEGYLPLDTATGIFDTVVGDPPLAANLAVQLSDWPQYLDAVATLLADTGAVDIWVDPVDTAMGYDPGIIGALNVANKRGSDLSGTVHFDWGTGDFNVDVCQQVDDADEAANKLIHFIGPKTPNGWQGNISATETTPEDLSAYLALEEASRAAYWTIVKFRFVDVNDKAETAPTRKLYHALWKEEVRGSVDGQVSVHVTPTIDCEFRPFRDYMPGDRVALNVADTCGPEIAGQTQLIDGFDVSVDVDGIGTVSPLQTIQDA